MFAKGKITTEAASYEGNITSIPLIHLQLSFIKKAKTILNWNCRTMYFGRSKLHYCGEHYLELDDPLDRDSYDALM